MGLEYRVPVLLPRQMVVFQSALGLGDIDHPEHPDLIDRLEARGMPIFDWFMITPGTPSEVRDMVYRMLIEDLQPGLTYFALHPAAPGDIETIAPSHAYARLDEYALFRDEAFKAFVAGQPIHLLGCRTLREFMRETLDHAKN